jgi:hypothetical protein
MTIEKVNEKLPISDRVSKINDQVIEVSGLTDQAKFDVHEAEAIYDDVGLTNGGVRKYLRNYDMSVNTGAGAWYNWTPLLDESGYSIWKYDSNINYEVNTANLLYMDNKSLVYKGTASAETIQAFDFVFVYDGDYNDHSAEAATEEGTAFSLLSATTDIVYVGAAEKFSGMRFKFNVKASNNTLKFEYSQSGGTFAELTTTEHVLNDDTSNFRRDGAVTLVNTPSDWETTEINSETKYWIKITTTTTAVTAGTCFLCVPYNSVPALLALSSQNIRDEKWAFCDYDVGGGSGSRLYATFKNTGDPVYEGNNHITSSATHVLKQNFFRFNHALKGDFQDARYLQIDHLQAVTSDTTLTDENKIVLIDSSAVTVNVTLPTAVGREGKEFYLKVTDFSSGAEIQTTGSETIDGSGAQLFSAVNEVFKLVSDDTNWLIIEKYGGE